MISLVRQLMSRTYMVTFEERNRKLISQVFCNGTLAATGRAGNDPHMTVVRSCE